jgi:hypothetical protein
MIFLDDAILDVTHSNGLYCRRKQNVEVWKRHLMCLSKAIHTKTGYCEIEKIRQCRKAYFKEPRVMKWELERGQFVLQILQCNSKIAVSEALQSSCIKFIKYVVIKAVQEMSQIRRHHQQGTIESETIILGRVFSPHSNPALIIDVDIQVAKELFTLLPQLPIELWFVHQYLSARVEMCFPNITFRVNLNGDLFRKSTILEELSHNFNHVVEVEDGLSAQKFLRNRSKAAAKSR